VKPYKCPCGREHKFTAWAAAHMHIEIVHTCNCGRENVLKGGKVIRSELKR